MGKRRISLPFEKFLPMRQKWILKYLKTTKLRLVFEIMIPLVMVYRVLAKKNVIYSFLIGFYLQKFSNDLIHLNIKIKQSHPFIFQTFTKSAIMERIFDIIIKISVIPSLQDHFPTLF